MGAGSGRLVDQQLLCPVRRPVHWPALQRRQVVDPAAPENDCGAGRGTGGGGGRKGRLEDGVLWAGQAAGGSGVCSSDDRQGGGGSECALPRPPH